MQRSYAQAYFRTTIGMSSARAFFDSLLLFAVVFARACPMAELRINSLLPHNARSEELTPADTDVVIRDRPMSIGASEEMSSPNAAEAMARIWNSVQAQSFNLLPTVQVFVQAWPDARVPTYEEYRVQCMVDLGLVTPHAAILRPQLMHSSLMVAFGIGDPGSAVEARNHILACVTDHFNSRLAAFGAPPGGPPLHFTRPPWPKSWNFGVAPPWKQVFESLQATAERAALGLGCRLRARRPIHVSWQ